MELQDEERLIARCCRGEQGAWDQVFETHYDAVARYVFQMASDLSHEDVEEICQEAFLSAVRNLARFSRKCRLQTWLFQIAANKARDYREKRQAAKRGGGVAPISLDAPLDESGESTRHLEIPHHAPTPDEAMANDERLSSVRLALDELGNPCREIIELRFFGDLSAEEIGKALRLNPKTVSSRLSRCMEKFSGVLKARFRRERESGISV